MASRTETFFMWNPNSNLWYDYSTIIGTHVVPQSRLLVGTI
nr:MAG TPA: LRV protein FeS4 cluster [Caudoviricetes sp.]